MDIHYKYPSPQTYRLIPIQTVVIPYWLKTTISRYGIDPTEIHNTDKLKDKLSLSDIHLLSYLHGFNYGEQCNWREKNGRYLYLDNTHHHNDETDSIKEINDKINTISAMAHGNSCTDAYSEIRSLLSIPDEMYQSQKENTTFYKIELTSNNFILITIEAGFLNVLEAREDAKRFFSDYLKARCACEAIHEVSKTDIFEWYLASLA